MEKAEQVGERRQYRPVAYDNGPVIEFLADIIRKIILGDEVNIPESDRKALTGIVRRRALGNLRFRRVRPDDRLINAYAYNLFWRILLDDLKSQTQEGPPRDEEEGISFDELVRLLQPEPNERVEGEIGYQNLHQRLTLEAGFELTPQFLSAALSPYLEAVAVIQQVSNDVMQWPPRGVVIKSISRQSPIDVSLSGAADAITALKEEIIPWRKKHAQELAELQATHVRAEIRKKEAEELELRARSERERAESEKIRAEAAKVREEARQLQLDNEARGLELQRAKINLALELVSKMRPDLSQIDKYIYAMRLLPAIDTLATSEIEPNLLIP